jgi:Uma2 family endonuclease
MLETGIIGADERVELWEGWLVNKPIINPPHAAAIRRALRLLKRFLPVGWCYQSQLPIRLLDGRPEPDVAILRGVEEDYDRRHPTPADTPLLIEVSDTSIELDRVVAARMYARAGIAVYWIVNIPEQQVEVYTDPVRKGRSPRYRHRHDYQRGDSVALVLDGVEVARIPVADLLP